MALKHRLTVNEKAQISSEYLNLKHGNFALTIIEEKSVEISIYEEQEISVMCIEEL